MQGLRQSESDESELTQFALSDNREPGSAQSLPLSEGSFEK